MLVQADPAKSVKNALVGYLDDEHPTATAVLEVPDDYRPTLTTPLVLVADDGGPDLLHRIFAQPTIRVTVFAVGRTQARAICADIGGWLLANRPAGIARIRNVSAVLEAKDDKTGAFMASITVPTIVRPVST